MFDAEFYQNPYQTYRKLRADGQMIFSDAFGGSGTWLVPRYEGVAMVLNDPGMKAARSHRFFDKFSDDVKIELARFAAVFKQWIIFMDPPDHELWRKVTMSGFASTHVKGIREEIEVIVAQLLDNLEDRREFDFIKDFASLLPTRVIALMMGLDRRDCSKFAGWADDIARFFGNPGASLEISRKAQESFLSLYGYFHQVIQQRLERPGIDAVSLMIRSIESLTSDREQRAMLIHEVLPAQCAGLLFAGHETTGSLFGNGMHGLFRHPEQLSALMENPDLALPVVREMMRFDTAAQFVGRIVKEPFEFLGQQLLPDQIVLALVGSANRDERVYSDPDVFKIDRAHEPLPLTFGSGPHRCLGSHLAAMELEIALRHLVKRFPRLAPATASVEYISNFNFRGIRSMYVTVR